MASSGSIMLATPSPLPSTPELSHVEGRNCMGPIAPALEGPMFRPCSDSTLQRPLVNGLHSLGHQMVGCEFQLGFLAHFSPTGCGPVSGDSDPRDCFQLVQALLGLRFAHTWPVY